MSQDDALMAHYAQTTLARDIDGSLVALGKDPTRVTVDDLEAIDEFHMGGRPATRSLFDVAGFPRGGRILDIGSGYGGPARVGAAHYGLDVDGIDLTPQYVEVATDLSRRTGLADRTRFQAASALALPFADGTFAGAYMIHVGMNISDKARLMREVARVLASGAVFVIYDIMRVGPGDLVLPLPWSSVAETSAVVTAGAYRMALEGAGFTVISERDRRSLVRSGTAAAVQTPLPHRGPGWDTKVTNLASMVKGGVVAPIEIVARVAR